MPHPFEVTPEYLRDHLEEMVTATFADVQSQFLILPRGRSFVEYPAFQDAYEVLKRHTSAFSVLTKDTTWDALRENALTFMVLRTILGLSPPEWAELARSERGSDVSQSYARDLDVECRIHPSMFSGFVPPRDKVRNDRVSALVSVAVEYIGRGVQAEDESTVHRLAKIDTSDGFESLQYVAGHGVPYAVLLYERYLGRPFASHRDSISGLVGDVMESAIEEHLSRANISFRKTRRAERVPGFDQAPDFFVPDELNPIVVIEAKITGDDGTARDKATRIVHLAELRNQRIQQGKRGFEVVACIDGRGFGVRREDMRRILLQTEGKVFTLATLDKLISHTKIRDFLPL